MLQFSSQFLAKKSAPLEMPVHMASFLAKVKSLLPKPWTIVRRFDLIRLRARNSSLEGATELKLAPFCSF